MISKTYLLWTIQLLNNKSMFRSNKQHFCFGKIKFNRLDLTLCLKNLLLRTKNNE